MRPRLAPLVVAATALTAAFAPSAGAAITVEVTQNEGLKISVSGSESNLTVSKVQGTVTELQISESDNRQVTPAAGCREPAFPGPERVLCNLPPLAFVTLVGGTLRDKLVLAAGAGSCLCNGGSGNDEIRAAEGADFIQGGGGADVLFGGADGDVLEGGDGDDRLAGEQGNDSERGDAGNDVFDQGPVPDGADTLADSGGTGDEVRYAGRRGAVQVSVDTAANDGARPGLGQVFGEGDNVSTEAANKVSGGGGNDLLIGHIGPNTLLGGAGNDDLQGRAGDDVLDGGLGVDRLQGETGRDILNARDAIDDQVSAAISCGSQEAGFADVLDADVRDDDTVPLPSDCETVSQGMVKEDPNVHIRFAKHARGGGLRIGLRCPRKARRGCVGSLAVKRARGRGKFGKGVQYSIERGMSGTVSLAGGAAGPGASIRVRSAERGRLGPRTTFQTLTVGR